MYYFALRRPFARPLTALICLLYIGYGYGQGVVTGVVTEVGGETLLAANVVVPGTSIGAITDLDGTYRLNLKPGTYILQASYLGYESTEQEITIVAGQNIELNFSLASAAVTGQEILVTAQMLGQRAAINRQLNADGIVNIVSEEQIQELPDANAAEALGRLPGVSLRRAGGEANKVVLRGLNDKFSLISLNGVPVPATDANARGVDLSMFSQSSLAGIEVTKAVTPDMDADAIAGAINLVTRKAPEEKELRIDLGGGYNALEGSLGQYVFDARYGHRLFDEKLGVQLAFTNERLIRSRETFSQGWDIRADSSFQLTELGLNYNDEIRGRIGGNLLLDFPTGDGGTIRFNNFFNQTSRDRTNYSRNYPTTGSVSYNISDQERILNTLNNALSGENFLGKLEITWGLSHALTQGDEPSTLNMSFEEGGSEGAGMRDTPNELLDGPAADLIPLAYNNYRDAFLGGSTLEESENQDRDIIGQLNLKYPFTLNDKLNGSLKVGAKVRQKNRERTRGTKRARYNINSLRDGVELADGSIVPLDLAGTSFAEIIKVGGLNASLLNFIDGTPESRDVFGRFELVPLLDRDLMREWYDLRQNAIPLGGGLREYIDDLRVTTGNYDIQERISSAYVMGTLDIGKTLRVLGGLRFENETNEYEAVFAPNLGGFNFVDPSLLGDSTANYSANYVLPNLHLRIKPVDWFDLRLAATKTLARPDFSQRLPRLIIDRQNESIDRGSPNLRTTEAWNYDVIFSFYKSRYGLFTIGGFYKQLDNVFYNIGGLRILSQAEAENVGLGDEQVVGYTLSEPVNTDDTRVYGIEIDLQANLTFLPGFLKNLVFRANYSRIDSETRYPRFRIEEDASEFPPIQTVVRFQDPGKLEGQPENFGNVAVGYDQGGFSSRLSVFFQDDFLTTITGTGLRESNEKGFSNWALTLRQDFKKITLIANIRNLTDFEEGQFFRFGGLDRGSSRFGTQVDFRLRFNIF